MHNEATSNSPTSDNCVEHSIEKPRNMRCALKPFSKGWAGRQRVKNSKPMESLVKEGDEVIDEEEKRRDGSRGEGRRPDCRCSQSQREATVTRFQMLQAFQIQGTASA
jgi:hypothetical protein